MNDKNENNKVKEIFLKLKEAWKDKRKKAGLKLLGYFIFFFIFMLMASITSSIKKINTNTSTTTTTTVITDKYNDKQKDLLTNKYNVSYVINISDNEYKINGTLENNIVNGYLELSSGIKKIVIKNNSVYELVNEEEVLLDSEIDNNYIDLNYIFNLIKQNSAIIKNEDDNKIYSYNIDDVKYEVICNDASIIKITIVGEKFSYVLNFDK